MITWKCVRSIDHAVHITFLRFPIDIEDKNLNVYVRSHPPELRWQMYFCDGAVSYPMVLPGGLEG